MIDPHDLFVGVRLEAGERGVEGPGGAVVGGFVGPHLEHRPAGVDADSSGPGGAVGRPVHRRIGMEGVARLQGQVGLPPGGAAVGRVELGLHAATADVVGSTDDLHRIPIVDADIGLAARHGLEPRDPLLAGNDRLVGERLAGELLVRIGSRVLLRHTGFEILMGDHPLVHLLEDVGIAARGIGRGIDQLGMRAAPDHPQPERDADLVLGLVGPQQGEVLVGSDQRLERALGNHGVGPELVGERGPGGLRPLRASGQNGYKSQQEDQRSLRHGAPRGFRPAEDTMAGRACANFASELIS